MWQEGAANAIPAKAHDLLANYERGEVKVSGELLVLPICQNQFFSRLVLDGLEGQSYKLVHKVQLLGGVYTSIENSR